MSDSTPLSIRRAGLSDGARIAQFNRQLAFETEGLQLDADTVARGVAALLRDPAKGIYFVAEMAGEIVGQVLITYEWSDWRDGNFWWIQSVYVDKAFRGRSIFKMLYQHVQSLARETPEVCGLRLYVDAENGQAQQAYSRLGMKKTDYEMFEVCFARSPRSR